MIIQKSFLNKLKDFGLNTYESKLWTALLSRGISTAGELSDIANVPRSRSYDVLESLEKKGFIVMKLGKPIKYIAVPPEEVIERVKKKLEEDAQEKTMLMEELKKSDILSELTLLHKQGIESVEPSDLSGSFRGRNSIYQHLETMIKNSKKHITIMTTESGLIRKAESLKRTLTKAKERGVKIKIAAPVTKETSKIANSLSKIAEIKHTTNKSRFCIVDNNELMFMLIDDKDIHSSYDVGIWVKTKLFASTLQGFFDTEWKKMKSVD